MALLGVIPVGTGVLNLDFVPESLLVIDTVTGVQSFTSVTQFALVQSGRQLANLTGARVAGFARAGRFINGAAQILAESLELANGRVNGSSTLTITNGGANPLNVFGVSSRFSNEIANYVETSINANANQSFQNFDMLLLSTPANVDRVNITFSNGFNDDFTPNELRQLIGAMQNTDASGQLNGALVVPNVGIETAIVFINGTGNCVVGVKRTLIS